MAKQAILILFLLFLAGCGVVPISACVAIAGDRPPGGPASIYPWMSASYAVTSGTDIDIVHSRHAVEFYPYEGSITFKHAWVVTADAVTQAAEVVAQGGWSVEAVGSDGNTLASFSIHAPPPSAEQLLATKAKWFWFITWLRGSYQGKVGERISFERSGSIATTEGSVYELTGYEELCTSNGLNVCEYPIDAEFRMVNENTGLDSVLCRTVNTRYL